jgi:hypothetical protein
MRTPSPGDIVTLAAHPDDVYVIFACTGDRCGITSDSWPRGATSAISLHELGTVNGVAVKFPAPLEENPRRSKSRR